MSKSDGWDKTSSWQWRKGADTYRASIDKITGGYPGQPYDWAVHPLPRAEHIGPDGIYRPVGKGSCRTLAEAKAEADQVINQYEASQ